MKNLYLLLFVFLFAMCSDDNEIEKEYNEIKIEKHYPYLNEKKALDDIDSETAELFDQKAYAIHSIEQLNEDPLFNYSPDVLKEELVKCDFEKYTIIMSSFLSINEIIDLESTFSYNITKSEYSYLRAMHCKHYVETDEVAYLVLNAFLIKKIPVDSRISSTTAFYIEKEK